MSGAFVMLALLSAHVSLALCTFTTLPQVAGNLEQKRQDSCVDDPSTCGRPPDPSLYICENTYVRLDSHHRTLF